MAEAQVYTGGALIRQSWPGPPSLAAQPEICLLQATRALDPASAVLSSPLGAGTAASWVCRLECMGDTGEGLGRGDWLALILPT